MSFIAAFRARSLGRGFARGFSDVAAAVADAIVVVVGRDICASFSVMLILVFSSDAGSNVISYCFVCFGGRVSLTCGMDPAIDVSGIPAFRGRGGWGSRG